MHKYNLRSYHISCLYNLYKHKGITATDLVEMTQQDKASISRSIDFLQDNEYIYCQSKTLKKYKSGGYYTYNSKDLESYLNYEIQKLLDNATIQIKQIDTTGLPTSLICD